MTDLVLSPKYKVFLRTDAPVEFLEGTTAAGKTTVGAVKFLLKVARSPKKQHIISGLDTGTIEKNILTKDLGVLDIFDGLVEYNPNGKGAESLPHLLFHTSGGDKTVYILGYDNKARWKKALGGQYGCLYIDEINVADMEYVREASMRCDYLMNGFSEMFKSIGGWVCIVSHNHFTMPQKPTEGRSSSVHGSTAQRH